ncbi:hypothetical protein BHAOGJBA_4554 [Methylobacterium hispanicum]|uniref:Uncharacterized protein n=1 Tax=Methylobacterium hispanicum TaxID=270350 RepID=A0AAV4ZR50_9HYPH|nr:hypothetical protein [Methylobacterium hispanicum]GJD91010.1 hypothetical protein BHAOGJBA_4554 [Methylobacterium hispanicum]
MKLEAALHCLGGTRVIWIDDHFNDTPAQLATMFIANLEKVKVSGVPEFADLLERDEFEPEATEGRLVQALTDMREDRRDEVKAIFFDVEKAVEGFPVDELSTAAVERACSLLAIADKDRWTFDGVEQKIRDTVREGDGNVSYIVDLKESRGTRSLVTRGMDILKVLATEGSRGTAFILTHETVIANEGKTEVELRMGLEPDEDIPLCVISKQRLAGRDPDTEVMEEAFRVAIKRAGLRRGVHEVLTKAAPQVPRWFEDARGRLLRIPPERLDAHVVERGYEEGVSELHVLERTLTAHMAQKMRSMFATDETVRASSERLRALRGIKLAPVEAPPDEDLVAFRNAETWEEADLINASFAPIASGDVFELDLSEFSNKQMARKRFVLIGQACEIGLRPNGKRGARTGILLPLKAPPKPGEEKTGAKQYVLQCTLDGVTPVVDLRNPATVDLSIMDLASFRSDGAVRFDKGQACPAGLLPGQVRIYGERTGWLSDYVAACEDKAARAAAAVAAAKAAARPRPVAAPVPEAAFAVLAANAGDAVPGAPAAPPVEPPPATPDAASALDGPASVEASPAEPPADLRAEMEAAIERLRDAYKDQASTHGAVARRLLLAVASPDDFKNVAVGGFEPAKAAKGRPPHVPARVTWRLIRCGRIREPFAADILSNYLASVGRNAFEIDFVLTGGGAAPAAAAKPAGPTAVALPALSPAPAPAASSGGEAPAEV